MKTRKTALKLDPQTERLYRGFMARDVKRVENLNVPDQWAKIGKVESIVYLTKEGIRVVRYVHDFEKPLPDLLTGNLKRNGAALIVGGDFRFTPRGFVG